MTDYIAYLLKGTRKLQLDGSAGLALFEFVPPSTSEAAYFADGTSANVHSGGMRTSVKASNKSWSFSVRALSSTNGGCEALGRQLRQFLYEAGDEAEPLYLVFCPDNILAQDALWGQRLRRVEIKHCYSVDKWDQYFIAAIRSSAIIYDVNVEIGPYILGKRQILAQAKGGIFVDTLGQADGMARGVAAPYSGTNQFSNPVFGNSTYTTNWTIGASLEYKLITDNIFGLGINSVELTRVASVDAKLTESINVGGTSTFTLSFLARKADNSAVTSSDVAVYYDSTQSSCTYSHVGNNIYRVSKSFNGIASATAAGLVIQNVSVTLYVTGFQLENTAGPTPLYWGDNIGCTWASTAHASKTTRAASYLRIPIANSYNRAEGTYRVVLKMARPNTGLPSGSSYLFDTGSGAATSLRAAFVGSNNTWNFGDGTNLIASNADSWSALDKMVFHFVFEPGSLKIYKDGAQIATGSTYTPPTAANLGSYTWIGTDQANAAAFPCTFMGFKVLEYGMSATEVLNDYNNIKPLVDLDQMVDAIPGFWTDDGDSQLDQAEDATRDIYGVAFGIPGDAPAYTRIDATLGLTNSLTALYLANVTSDINKWVNPYGQYFFDYDGTGTTAADSGSAATTASSTIGLGLIPASPNNFPLGKTTVFCRLSDAGSNLTAHLIDEYTNYSTLTKGLSADATRRIFYIGSLDLSTAQRAKINSGENLYVYVTVSFGRSSGGPANYTVDYALMIPGITTKMTPITTFATGDVVRLVDGIGMQGPSGAFQNSYPVNASDNIELSPNMFNTIMWISGNQAGAHTVTDTATLAIYVTPRWSIL